MKTTLQQYNPNTPVTAPPLAPTQPASPPQVRRSTRARLPTEGGKVFAADIAASKACLEELRQARADRAAQCAKGEGVPDTPLRPEEASEMPANLEDVEPNPDVPEVLANLMIEEQSNIAIRSNKRRNPASPDYDMSIPPATFEEAMLCLDRAEWLEAMQKELQIMREMKVYEMKKLPEGRKAIGSRWVLEFKEDNKGGSSFKARLVAQGFSQIPSIDYGAMFAPVLKTVSLRVIASVACKKNWNLESFDARRAFLWGVLKEDIYMRQPKGFEEGDWKVLVWKMLHTIYGLKQSAMEWYEEIKAVMEELGFARCAVDYVVFIYDHIDTSTGTRTFCIIGWHVDDSLGTSNSPKFLAWVKFKVNSRFGIKDLGEVAKFLGIQFERDRLSWWLWMHQGEYIKHLLDEYDLLECNPVLLPLDPAYPFGRTTESHPTIPNLGTHYCKLIGELLYLAICTRPDISFAVNSLAQHNATPLPSHYAAAKRVLCYLSGTIDLHLQYGGDRADDELHGFCDADWASAPEDRLSISGYAWYYGGGLITHISKKQSTHTLSSTEAEYMAMTHAIQEGLWLTSLFTTLHLYLPLPVIIEMDNTGAITLSTEARNHIHSKHIDVRYLFIREHIAKDTFLLKWLPSHRNMADILMKALARPLFLKHLTSLQLVSR